MKEQNMHNSLKSLARLLFMTFARFFEWINSKTCRLRMTRELIAKAESARNMLMQFKAQYWRIRQMRGDILGEGENRRSC